MSGSKKESWNSRIGVILAVAGSAVGLGNFLRFPGQVAEYGGGAFMIAYFISFLLIGLPICWAEWTMGRHGGQSGFNSCPGIMGRISGHPAGKWLGIIGVVVPVIIYMYYVLIEAWCLGYATNFLLGNMNFPTADESLAFLKGFTGMEAHGSGIGFAVNQVGIFLIVSFVLNFFLIYRGISRGIELFCKYAVPMLILIAVIIVIRVLTLGAPDPANPQNSIQNGLGFMWNPNKTFLVEEVVNDDGTLGSERIREFVGPRAREEAESVVAERQLALQADADSILPALRIEKVSLWQQLLSGKLWLAAAGQIFFSLSVGFGVIITYSSYLKKDDDIVLSGLAATSANEFAEVGIGGIMSIPAAYAFLGMAGLAGMTSTFALGFIALPNVFSVMPGGQIFGFLFFFLLFLAAVTSSLSMLQPGIAFIEEALNLTRKQSVALLGFITFIGTGYVSYFSTDTIALDTMDFWVGTVMIYVLATVQIIIFSWVFGVEKGFEAAHRGSAIRIPLVFKYIMKYVSPTLLLIIFSIFILQSFFGLAGGEISDKVLLLIGTEDVAPNPVAWGAIAIILAFALLCVFLVSTSQRISASTGGQKTLPNQPEN
ncbi:MAG TPA: sodium:calcium symporter [Opitutales bacterium]|nr:sodium:calcium symporter [Opitutales bacterium]